MHFISTFVVAGFWTFNGLSHFNPMEICGALLDPTDYDSVKHSILPAIIVYKSINILLPMGVKFYYTSFERQYDMWYYYWNYVNQQIDYVIMFPTILLIPSILYYNLFSHNILQDSYCRLMTMARIKYELVLQCIQSTNQSYLYPY